MYQLSRYITIITLFLSTTTYSQTYTEDLETSFTYTQVNTGDDDELYLRSQPIELIQWCSSQLEGQDLYIRISLGEDYRFGSTTFTEDVDVIVEGYSTFSGGTAMFTRTINMVIDQSTPEQLYHLDLGPWQNQLVRVKLSVSENSGNMNNDMQTDFVIDAYIEKDITYKPISGHQHVSDAPSLSSHSINFDWASDGCGFPNYEIQLLRLYNQSDQSPYISDPEQISTIVDWTKALSIIVGSETDYKLTLAEGTGYYAYRIRPIGDYYTHGQSDPRNWGEWTTHLAETSTPTTITSSHAGIGNYLFYYTQFDDDKNWIYNRTFVEGDKSQGKELSISEGISYYNYLNMPEQQQSHLYSNDSIVATQTVYDYMGRPALVSLPAPISKGNLGYKTELLKTGSDKYTAEDFDIDTKLTNPAPVDSGTSSTNLLSHTSFYYSRSNDLDASVPSAAGYPFSRTSYYADGTGRPKIVSGAGKTLRHGTNTTRTYYGSVSDIELIRLFADEAPDNSRTYKQLIQDPNGVVSISYINQFGQTIASCLNYAGGDNMDRVDDSDPSFSVVDTINDFSFIGNQACATRRYVFPSQANLGITLNLTPNIYGEDCEGFCESCDYEIIMTIYNVDDPGTITTILRDTIAAENCGSQSTYTMSPAYSEDLTGEYIVTTCISTHSSNSDGEEYLATLSESLYEEIFDSFEDKFWNYLDSYNLDRFYVYTDSIWGTEAGEIDSVINILVGCDTIFLEYLPCDTNRTCDNIYFEEYLCDYMTANLPNPQSCTDGSGGLSYLPGYDVGEFDNMIANMYNSGSGLYECDSLWLCWKAAVSSYVALQSISSTVPSQYPSQVDLLDLFLDCTGRHFAGFTDTYDPEYAYRRFEYELGDNEGCEDILCGTGGCTTADTSNFTELDFYKLYECNKATTLAGQYPNLFGTPEEIEYDYESLCDSACLARYPYFLDSLAYMFSEDCYLVEAYEYMISDDCLDENGDHTGGTVSLHDLHCYAFGMLENCRQLCDLTLYGTGSCSNDVDSLGSRAELENYKKILFWDFDIDATGCTPDVQCESGYDCVPSSPTTYSANELLIEYLNYNLAKIKDTLGIIPDTLDFDDIVNPLIDNYNTDLGRRFTCDTSTVKLEDIIIDRDKYSYFWLDCP